MHFSGGNQRCDPAVQSAVNPVQLLLSRGVVTDNRMDMAVNQSGRKGHPVGVDLGGCVVDIKIFLHPPSGDFAVQGHQTVSVQNGLF